MCWLRKQGFHIAEISRDQFQSEYLAELLEGNGFSTSLISLDRTPDGYIALADFNLLTGMDLYDGTVDTAGNAVHDFCFEVENTKQMQLPVTGEHGMDITIMFGAVLVTLGGTYLLWFVLYKRKKKGGCVI